MNKQEIEVQDPYFVQNEVAEKIIQLSGIKNRISQLLHSKEHILHISL